MKRFALILVVVALALALGGFLLVRQKNAEQDARAVRIQELRLIDLESRQAVDGLPPAEEAELGALRQAQARRRVDALGR